MSDPVAGEPAGVQLARMEGKLDAALVGLRSSQAEQGRRIGALEQDVARWEERTQVQAVTLAEQAGKLEATRDELTRLRQALEALPSNTRANVVAGIALAGLALSLLDRFTL